MFIAFVLLSIYIHISLIQKRLIHDFAKISKSSVCGEEDSRERAGDLQERWSKTDVLAHA